MKCIYFNHKGLENSNSENLLALLQELSEKIEICKNENYTVGFYKEIFNLQLINLNSTFINYICSDSKYRNICNVIIFYIDTNMIYPKNYSSDFLTEDDDYKCRFLKICVKDNVSSFISLSNDSLFNRSSYTIENKMITNFINQEDLSKFVKISASDSIDSYSDVFNKIESKYKNQVKILRSATISARQIETSNKAYNHVYSALYNLVEIILPTNSNTLTKDICEKYYSITSLKISKESKKTANNPKYKRHRTFDIDGKYYLFQNHVKIGNSIRIHYYIHNKKLYIGHCGTHLPTSEFN